MATIRRNWRDRPDLMPNPAAAKVYDRWRESYGGNYNGTGQGYIGVPLSPNRSK